MIDKRPPFRAESPAEAIGFVAHRGQCRYCLGVVKMRRDDNTLVLLPDQCACLLCGQRYFVELGDEGIEAWETRQWIEKGAIAGEEP